MKYAHLSSILALLLLTMIGGLVYHSLLTLSTTAALVTQSYQQIKQQNDLLSSLRDAETGQRGYVITGDVAYLETYTNGRQQLAVQLQRLRTTTGSRAEQQRQLAQLEPLITDKLAELEQTIMLRRTQGFDAARKVVATDQGKRSMDAIRQIVGELDNAENTLLSERAQQANMMVRQTLALGSLGVVLAWLIVALASYRMRQNGVTRQHAEDALRQSEARLRTATDGGLDAFVLLDSVRNEYGKVIDFTYVDLNTRAEKLLRLSKLTVTGQHMLDLFPGAHSSGSFDKLVAVLESGVVLEEELPGAAPSPQVTWMRWQVVPLADGVAITIRDISERKQMEELLRHERDLLHALMDSIPDNIYFKDTAGRFTRINRAQALHLGVQHEDEAIGKTDADFFEDQHATEAWQDEQQLIAMGEPLIDRIEHYQAPDGLPVWISATKVPIRDDAGQLVGLVGISRNITARMQAEEELRQRLAQHRALLSAIPDLMLRYNQQGTCLDYKPFTAGGFSLPSKVIGTTIRELLPPKVAAIIQAAVEQVLTMGDQLSLDFEYTTPSGCTDYEARFSPCGDGEVVCLIQDISDRKAVERMKNEFVSMVSHELRTPLTSIRGSLGLLAGGVTGPLSPPAQTMIAIAHTNSERLVRLINDILDIDKIESGNMVFELQPLRLAEVVNQAIESTCGYAEQFDVHFQLQAPDAELRVMADADRLTQVLTNLLSNAAKYSPHGEVVEVGILQQGALVRVTVADHGPGISPEFEHRIFQKFAQADSSATRQKGGTGLGLSISKAIVERLDGHLGFTSVINRGSTFYLELPVVAPETGTATVLLERSGLPRVLHVDDDADLCHVITLLLRDVAEVVSVATLDQAQQLLQQHPVDLLLLDLALPDGWGAEIVPWMAAHLPTPIPVIVFSVREVDYELRAYVTAALVKSRTSNLQLIETIKQLLPHTVQPTLS
ncbi:MAG: CHASE3 domain-containing protein [Herpetosiphonaceae bacterium]|nr:CHASE3 domain-containing protein [Herpetosiphonaceae bacterium]